MITIFGTFLAKQIFLETIIFLPQLGPKIATFSPFFGENILIKS
jgi:hypothetical protein